MSIFTTVRDGVEYPFELAWDHIKPVFVEDIEPALKAFLKLFASDEGKLILTTALAAAPALATGNFGAVTASIISTVITGSEKIAAQDAAITLQQVQSALQIAKVSQGIATPKDQDIIANVAATEKATPQEA
jgi:hypothetical protein